MEEENKQQSTSGTGFPKMWAIVLIVVLVIAGGAFYFLSPLNKNVSSDNKMQGQENSVTEDTQPTTTAESKLKQITVEGGEFAFTPSAISVNKGDTVELTFKNTGKFPHDYVISDLGVKTKVIQPGEQDTITFVADKTGSFNFICSVGDHEEKGMVGTLTIQ